jgi:hypothetical protein
MEASQEGIQGPIFPNIHEKIGCTDVCRRVIIAVSEIDGTLVEDFPRKDFPQPPKLQILSLMSTKIQLRVSENSTLEI